MAKALFSRVLKFLENHSETKRLRLDGHSSKGNAIAYYLECFEFEKFQFTINLEVDYIGYYEAEFKEFSYDITNISCEILEIYDTREEEYLQFSKSEIADLERELSTSLNIELYKL